MPLAHPIVGQPRTVEILKTEEKGYDVNLAVQLLHDAYQNRYETAVIISGDSDLPTPPSRSLRTSRWQGWAF